MVVAKGKKLIPWGKISRRFSFRIAILFLLFSLFTVISYSIAHNSISEKRDTKQYTEFSKFRDKITEEFSLVEEDLIKLSQHKLSLTMLLNRNKKYHSISLMHDLLLLVKDYDQVRLLDTQGCEVMRVNKDSGLKFRQVSKDNLQNKSQRYYVKNAMVLESGEIYISKFDLNRENGKVEQPIKPMIRFSTPIHSLHGELIGIGVINYLGDRILNLVDSQNTYESSKSYLINNQGYYLKGDNSDSEWSFMFPDREQVLFQNDYPEVWEQMHNSVQGKVSDFQGEYYYSRFYLSTKSPAEVINDESIYLITHVPRSVIFNEEKSVIYGLVLLWLVIFPLALALAYKLPRNSA
ncbi:cache domain-containing protein [Vibrio sp. JC009]|uniref:hypothetical protein n=1 Tax=Vibrio sp. JC009 TaxID=2912314 RepID=UPI0023AF0C92|nr:hypothetical protein [Vibrio sp. JC009]WED23872.1 cache domain-containing protein [Vibrio sp. JC009]